MSAVAWSDHKALDDRVERLEQIVAMVAMYVLAISYGKSDKWDGPLKTVADAINDFYADTYPNEDAL